MENQINWITIQNGRGRMSSTQLEDYEIKTYRCTTSKNKSSQGNYITFSKFLGEIYFDYKIKVGTMGNRMVLNFNKENGLNLCSPKSIKNKDANVRVNSVDIINLIFEKAGYDKEESSNIYNLIDIGNNSFIITRKIN